MRTCRRMAVMLVASLALGALGCGGQRGAEDSRTTGGSAVPPRAGVVPPREGAGTWRVAPTDVELVLREDGTFDYTSPALHFDGTWSLQEKRLILNPSPANYASIELVYEGDRLVNPQDPDSSRVFRRWGAPEGRQTDTEHDG